MTDLPGLLAGLSPEQRRFVAVRLETTTDAEAARRCRIPVRTVYQWPNLTDVRRAVELATLDAVEHGRDRLRRLVGAAVDALEAELHNPSPRSRRVDVALAILDRTIGKPTEAVRVESAADTALADLLARVRASLPTVEESAARLTWDNADVVDSPQVHTLQDDTKDTQGE